MTQPPLSLLSQEELEAATPEERAAYKRYLELEVAKQSPLDLMCLLDTTAVRARHLEHVNEITVALVENRLYKSGPGPAPVWYYIKREGDRPRKAVSYDKIPEQVDDWWGEHPETGERVLLRLGIAMPPRHGKSYLIAEFLPLWYLLRYPNNDIAFATYSDDFGAHWGKKARDKYVEFGDRLGLHLKNGERHNTAHLEFKESKGNIFFVGTGGALTGKGYQLGIIDDPFKDAAEAMSPAIRKSKADWYSSTFETRKTRRKGHAPVEIMCFTRWHEDDLSGRFVYDERKHVRDDWYMIRLPALAGDDDPLGREPGEALWPRVKTRTQLLAQQKANPVWFAALFQGVPSLGDQGMFPSWQFYENHDGLYIVGDGRIVQEADCFRFATVDTAYTTNTWSDYSVFSVWDWHRQEQILFLRHVTRQRVESPELTAWLRNNATLHSCRFVGVEDVTSGKQLIQQLVREGGVTIRPLKADKDKVSRALPYAQAVGQGKVRLPKNQDWVMPWIEEHSTFPFGAHEDMVDTGGYAWRVVLDMPSIPDDTRHKVDTTLEGKIKRMHEKMDRKEKLNDPVKRRRSLMSGRMGR